ncbi:DUF2461 domain-containing protein [Mangrovimonas sp. YM274]|uniref:DUF2461 domain-containing protein n=1 Tax=Mangrovimonas sp. YM274 TaxID=3070660 RepID=UPI0027DCF4D2|nr:DUF2461 domain-containing protein [Mangrovimonas sp. YM274]WMI67308.1 DUF2461 domain-containing protein [Mangrovimonas sp. YM274]
MTSSFSPEVFDFLKRLKQNNEREWFNEHKKEFKTIEKDVKSAYNTLFELLKTHDDVDHLKLFRIYRDVRFSKNKAPYKTHFGGSFRRTKPELRGGYYLHLAPNNESFIATGFWEPNKEDLLRMRREFEMDASMMRNIISEPKFKSVWGELQGDELKSAPRDFNKEDPAIDLIRKKQYIFTKTFTDKEVLSKDFLENVNIAFQAVRPYFDYMSEVLTTNLNGESII